MNILFLHNNFPAQFIHLVQFFSEDKLQKEKNKIVFISQYKRGDLNLPEVVLKKAKICRKSKATTRPNRRC